MNSEGMNCGKGLEKMTVDSDSDLAVEMAISGEKRILAYADKISCARFLTLMIHCGQR